MAIFESRLGIGDYIYVLNRVDTETFCDDCGGIGQRPSGSGRWICDTYNGQGKIKGRQILKARKIQILSVYFYSNSYAYDLSRGYGRVYPNHIIEHITQDEANEIYDNLGRYVYFIDTSLLIDEKST